jgi:hypothetical protein
MEVPDVAVLAGIRAAFSFKNVRKNAKNTGVRYGLKIILKSRNSRIIRGLEFNEHVLLNNFTLMSKTNFYTLLGILEPMITKQNTNATG